MDINQDAIVNMVAAKTDFYKKDVRAMMEALEEVFYENLSQAEIDQPIEIKPFFGLIIGAKKVPPYKCKDPRNGEIIMSSEKLRPYCVFGKTFKMKLNEGNEKI